MCVLSLLPNIIATRRFAAPTGFPGRKEKEGPGNLSLVLVVFVGCFLSLSLSAVLYITILFDWFLKILSLTSISILTSLPLSFSNGARCFASFGSFHLVGQGIACGSPLRLSFGMEAAKVGELFSSGEMA